MVSHLYRRFRNMWCRISAHCIRTIPLSMRCGSYHILVRLKSGREGAELGWPRDVNEIMW